MTVFCALFSDVGRGEEPVLLSDVLLTASVRHSSDGDRYRRTYIPSVGGTFPQVSREASIAGLCQKLYVTKSGSCFAVAGDLSRVLEIHSALAADLDINAVVSTCSKFKDDLQFVVFVPDDERQINYLCASANCTLMRPGPYGLVVIGGSGESTLRQLLLRQAEQRLHGDETVLPIARALCLVNEALDMDEEHPEQTLGDKFGAYYEIAAYSNGQYRKVDHVSHHYLRFVTNAGDGYWQLTKSYFHEYLGDDLVVRRVTFGRQDGELAVWQDCYVIEGFERPLDAEAASTLINSCGPTPIWEVLSLEIAGGVFRMVSTTRHLLRSRISEGRWHFSVDEELGQILAQEIFSLLDDGDG